MAKKRIKKAPIIIIVLLLLIALVGMLIGFIGLEVKIVDKKEVYEVGLNYKEVEEANIECTFFGSKENNIKKDKEIDTSKIGDQEITYTCTKILFKKSIKVKYTVVDKDAPKIELKGNKIKVVTVGDSYTEEGYTATDDIDGDITKEVKTESKINYSNVGNYKIKYQVTDKAGNETTAEREILVRTANGYYYGCGEENTIYLTFDDGPNNTTTTQILDTLKKYNVKATFFVTNTNGGDDSQIKREFDEGHKIAIHTDTHDYSKLYASVDAFWTDMNKIQERIVKITGEKPDVMRFPGGSSNTVSRRYSPGIMLTLIRDVEEKGYSYVDWNVDSRDAEPAVTKTGDDVANNVTSGLVKTRGNVILMHDIKQTTAAGLEKIIQYGQNRGYKFDVLSRDVICHHGVNNK